MLIIDFNDLWQAEVKVVLNWGQEKESNRNFGGKFFFGGCCIFLAVYRFLKTITLI